MKFWETFRRAIAAGSAICMGAAVYLSCDNKVVGAVFFCVGLYAICAFSLNLYTGKIGYVLENKNPLTCLVIWLGNLTGCFLTALPLRFAGPKLADAAARVTSTKLSLNLGSVFFLSLCCGILVYIAVENFRAQTDAFGKALGILLAIPVFILCGFEHSVADMCYFILGVGGARQSLDALIFLVVCSVGNGVGSVLFRLVSRQKQA